MFEQRGSQDVFRPAVEPLRQRFGILQGRLRRRIIVCILALMVLATERR